MKFNYVENENSMFLNYLASISKTDTIYVTIGKKVVIL